MKKMKKLASFMLALIMVLAMAMPVGAAGETTEPEKGTITITNPVKGHTYTIYQILELESYNTTTGTYSYKIKDAKWKTFLEGYKTGEGESAKSIFLIDAQNYVTIQNEMDANEIAAFAKAALAYAKTNSIANAGTATYEKTDETEGKKIEFSGLELGYYLVDSTLGTLCALNTTTPGVDITEKNEEPTLVKKVEEDSKPGEWGDKADADIGQTVNFQVTITAKEGAQNYIMHDKMGKGLKFNKESVVVTLKKASGAPAETVAASNYSVNTDLGVQVPCTFHVEFTQAFCDTLKDGDEIVVTYSAVVQPEAYVMDEGKNTAHLAYGENGEFTTTPDEVEVKTYQIPIFKYYKNGTTDTGLAGAKFTLSKNSDGTEPIKFTKVTTESGTAVYRVDPNGDVTEITTEASGKFIFRGLDADTYYLTETEAPAGYNKLSGPVKIKVTVGEDGEAVVTYGDGNVAADQDLGVKVLNQSGSVLPTTGGIGTTIFYVLGGILVTATVVLLVTRKRMSAEK